MESLVRKCKVCGIVIPEGRIKILPNTHTCVEHSDTSKYYVRTVINSDEDYGELEVIKDNDLIEKIKKYEHEQGNNGMLFGG